MKWLLVLFLVPFLAMAQPGVNKYDYLQKDAYDGTIHTYTIINARSFAGGVTDTTKVVDISRYPNVYFTFQAKDSISLLIYYQLRINGATWTASTLTDSLKQSSDVSIVKTINLSSITLGTGAVRLVLITSAAAYALGTTTPTYTATYKLAQ